MIPLTRPPFVPEINGVIDPRRTKIQQRILDWIRVDLDSGIISKGSSVKALEESIAEYVGTKYAVALNSCTSGLQLVLEALDIGHRDKVLCPNFTYPSTKLAIENVGATPLYVDVEDDYCSWKYELNNDKIMSSRIHAAIGVDLFGNESDIHIEDSSDFSTWNGHFIIDAACGLGIDYKRAFVINEWAKVFSFHPRKIITTGEGGMVCTNDESVFLRLRSLTGYDREVRKYNLRMSDVQAVMGLVQMDYLEDIIADRRRAAKVYDDLIADRLQGKFAPHPRQEGVRQTFQSYVGLISIKMVRSQFITNQDIIELMQAKGIEVQVGSYYVDEDLLYAEFDCTATTHNGYKFARYCLALPIYYGITEDDQQRVIQALTEVLT